MDVSKKTRLPKTVAIQNRDSGKGVYRWVFGQRGIIEDETLEMDLQHWENEIRDNDTGDESEAQYYLIEQHIFNKVNDKALHEHMENGDRTNWPRAPSLARPLHVVRLVIRHLSGNKGRPQG